MKKTLLMFPILFLIYWGCEEEQEVDTTPPTVSIQSLISNQTINEIVTIVVETNDNEGIDRVEFYIDDSLFFTDTESPYEYAWNTTEYEDSSDYTIKVVSYDNSENSAEFQIVVWVDNSIEIEVIPEYFGTYLYNDHDCSGSDIQYATLDENGITFFDYLGDSCDDTVSCYAMDIYELTVLSQDTFLIVSEDSSSITDGEMYLDGDSSITISYEGNNGPVEYSWEKISSGIYSFTPVCDQEYESTKDLADMLVYAVSDNGDLLWKNYIHGGIWDLGASVAPLDDGGYMVFGIFDGIEWGGCCYTKNAGARDIIKLNNQGIEQWRREINYIEENNTFLHWSGLTDIGNSLIQTSQGDLVVIAPGLDHYTNILMLDTLGNVIWTKNFSGVGGDGLYSWSGHNEILETETGDLAVIGGSYVNFLLLDYATGDILEQKEYDGLRYAKAIISDDDNYVMIGMLNDPESFSNRPLYLQKVSSEGDVIWRKTWENDSTKLTRGHDLISTSDNGYLLFCNSDPPPYATLIKTDSEGNEEWRKKYDDYTSGRGWIHQTEDGGYFMASVYAVTKLDSNGNVEWNAAASATSFHKYFNNGMVIYFRNVPL